MKPRNTALPLVLIISLGFSLAACNTAETEPTDEVDTEEVEEMEETETETETETEEDEEVSEQETETEEEVEEETDEQPTSETSDSIYVDGTYSANGTYSSPAGNEEVSVTITLEDDVIVSATFTGNATHPTSVKLQGMFSDGYEALVVGTSIDSVNLDVVNGSSLTPIGFENALNSIKSQAAA